MASYFVVPFATILIDSGAAQSHAKACNRPTDPLDISEWRSLFGLYEGAVSEVGNTEPVLAVLRK